MTPRTHKKLLRFALFPLAAAALAIAGCGSNSLLNTGTQSNGETGSAFLVGTDAPLASVVSFQVQLMAVELTNGTTTTSTLVNGTPTVDFARFNGLQTLVDMNQVPAGTYTGVTFVLGTGTVAYLNTSGSRRANDCDCPGSLLNVDGDVQSGEIAGHRNEYPAGWSTHGFRSGPVYSGRFERTD